MGVPLFFAFTAGMVATVNPCGFAMLPAYVSMFLTGSGQGEAPGVAQGLRVGGWVTSGFIVTFSLIGLITTAVSQTILDLMPWAAMVIGAALVAGGIGVLFGMKLKIGMVDIRFAKKSTPRSMGLFGAAYAVASISCTLPVFLAITIQAFAADSPGVEDGNAMWRSRARSCRDPAPDDFNGGNYPFTGEHRTAGRVCLLGGGGCLPHENDVRRYPLRV